MIKIIKQKYNKYYYAEEKNGICVVRRQDESDEELIKRFKKKFSKSGLYRELKEKMYFEKPSERKRRKKAQSIRNIEREEKNLEKEKRKMKKKNKEIKFKKIKEKERRKKHD